MTEAEALNLTKAALQLLEATSSLETKPVRLTLPSLLLWI